MNQEPRRPTSRHSGLGALLAPAALLAAACAGPPLGWPDLSAEDPEPAPDPDLRAYKEAHYRALGRDFVATARREEVLRTVVPDSVLFLGDHHVDAALHAEHVRILEDLAARGVDLVLGLEAVGAEDEPAVRRYLDREIDLDELRETVRGRWPGSWLDSPDVDAWHYRTVLALARRARWPVFALEPVPRVPLLRRDAVIAARIERARAAHPERAVAVIVGHTHLLGNGGLVGRIDAGATVVGARMSRSLRVRLAGLPDPGDRYLQSDAGVWFPPAAR